MILGYLPPVRDRQEPGLAKKRAEYGELKRRHYRFEEEPADVGDSASSSGVTTPSACGCGSAALSASAAATAADADGDDGVATLRQIRCDIPRTAQGSFQLFSHPRVQRLMERVLYIWSIRHPASGYVQGLNDLVVPFIAVLLPAELKIPLEEVDISVVPEAALDAVEAGVYWCLTKVLSDIQDHYTAGQPGIQKMVGHMKDVVRRIDERLVRHFDEEGLDFLQFAFRWMNCLLLREVPLHCALRLWDAYIAEPTEGFSMFHSYVCACFLVFWSSQFKRMDFQSAMLFMQRLPTADWTSKHIDSLLAEAFVLKSCFHTARAHLVDPNQQQPLADLEQADQEQQGL